MRTNVELERNENGLFSSVYSTRPANDMGDACLLHFYLFFGIFNFVFSLSFGSQGEKLQPSSAEIVTLNGDFLVHLLIF